MKNTDLGLFDDIKQATAEKTFSQDPKMKAAFLMGANWAKNHLQIIFKSKSKRIDELDWQVKQANDKIAALMMENID